MAVSPAPPPWPALIDQLKKLWTLDLVVQEGSFQRAAIAIEVMPRLLDRLLTDK